MFANIDLGQQLARASDWLAFEILPLSKHIEAGQQDCSEQESEDCAQPSRTPDVRNALIAVDRLAKPPVGYRVCADDLIPEETLEGNAAFDSKDWPVIRIELNSALIVQDGIGFLIDDCQQHVFLCLRVGDRSGERYVA